MKELNLDECLLVNGGDKFADAAAVGGLMSTVTGATLGLIFYQDIGINIVGGFFIGSTVGLTVGFIVPFVGLGIFTGIQKTHEFFGR
ncbi:hypothetical protein [Candidatus Berkiella aquae]|uniref:Uncharacterized protein n=1 Tax=Candidatus Berkiella aquae TaxID=295108 RepID=A0A0Q9YUW7_9GAMM|nr:hypothetical protein [Candidatus Berkiella aquae]MCS5711453.1 hypothetical protein [Candidatus Berkiella aquae]